jgi:hypothetical protein
MQIVDAQNPEHPEVLGTYSTPDIGLKAVRVQGHHAYLLSFQPPARPSGDALHIVNVSNPSAPQLQSTLAVPGSPGGLEVVNGLAYVMNGRGLTIADVSEPSHPFIWGRYDSDDSGMAGLVVVDGIVYLRRLTSVEVVDASDPSSPRRIGRFNAHSLVSDIEVEGDLLHIARTVSGILTLRVEEVPPVYLPLIANWE